MLPSAPPVDGSASPVKSAEPAAPQPAASEVDPAGDGDPLKKAPANAPAAGPDKESQPSDEKSRGEGLSENGKSAAKSAAAKPAADSKKAAKLNDAAEGPPDPWSTLRAAWIERDRLSNPDGNWTPIDYAPLIWRKYESTILDYEARRRNAADAPSHAELDRKFLQDFAIEQADLAEAKRAFLASRRPDEQLEPIRLALQCRNRGFYQAVDLVAWHARASCARADQVPEFPELKKLLPALGELDLLLAAAVAEPGPDASPDTTGQFAELEAARNRVQSELASLDAKLKTQAAVAIKDANQQTIVRGVARRIEDLLAVPLLDATTRMKLVEALPRTGQWPDRTRLASRAAEQSPAQNIRLQQETARRQSGLKQPWSRAVEQAQLEARLIALGDPVAAKQMLETIPPSIDAIGSGSRKLRELSEQLARHYRDFPDRIGRADMAALLTTDRELRLFPFVERVVVKADPFLLLHWAPAPVKSFDFAGFDAKLDLDAAGWKQLDGELIATGGFGGDVLFKIDFDPRKLQIETSDGAVTPGKNMKFSFGAANSQAPLHFRVRRSGLQARAASDITLAAVSADRPELSKTRTIVCEAPPPDDIELVIEPAPDVNNSTDEVQAQPIEPR